LVTSPSRDAWPALLAAALVALEAVLELRLPILAAMAIGLLAWRWSSCHRLLALLALAAAALEGTGCLQVLAETSPAAGSSRRSVEAKLDAVEQSARRLVTLLDGAAARVAALPEAQRALAGERAALSRLFGRLDEVRDSVPERPALAVDALPLATVAWAGRVVDLRAFEGIAGIRRDVFILAGSVTTTLVATTPIQGPGGRTVGFATAELPVAVRRNIRNEYLADFDRLAEGLDGVEIHYLDARDEPEGPRPFPEEPSSALAAERLLRAPDGGVLAAVRGVAPAPGESAGAARELYRQLVSALLSALLLAWTLVPGPPWRLRLAAGVTGLRVLLVLLGPPIPASAARLLSPDVYASAALGRFTRSPLDLLLTAGCLLILSVVALEPLLTRPSREVSHVRAWTAYLLGLPVLGVVFAWVADTSANCSLDLEALTLLPRSTSHLVLQTALLLILALGALVLTALFSLAGSLPRAPGRRLVRLGGVVAFGMLAERLWPRDVIGLPLVPAVLLFGAAALCAGTRPGTRPGWQAWLGASSPGAQAGLVLAAVAFISLLLYPALVHYGEKTIRQQIERDHAPLVLHQPQWREYVLAESQRRIDALDVLEEIPGGAAPLLAEELAFAVWSKTDLAAVGFSSAVEIQDPGGRVVSRFALNLPSAAVPVRPLPASEAWQTTREELPETSGGGRVLHSRRRLAYHGELHGAIHLYVKDDFWNLPFLRPRDPYSVLYRTATRSSARDRPVGLLVYDRARGLVFSSAERPPALDASLLARASAAPAGLWTTLTVDGRPDHTLLFTDAQHAYGLTYPRMTAGHFAADLVEAVSGTTLLAFVGLLVLLVVRTALGRRSLSLASVVHSVSERFVLRLFVAFVAVAFVPVVVLEGVVRSFVADRLRRESETDALERAAVAKKAVEDFGRFRGGEAPGRQPGLDAGLVYVASLIRTDLDVFARGRLLASSKGELYASGLLPSRVSGAVYRALVLEGEPAALTTERIGGFSYLVVSVPVRLEGAEAGILSIPQALRQREVEAVLQDLDRTIRLASVVFLLAAAGLALSMARRISNPIRDLTTATQRIAHGDLSARVPITSRDELSTLVESFNQMASDLQRQRRDLERSNRLAAWAELARQVAHEVKNPLTPIQLSAEHLRRVYRDASADLGATLESCTDTILKQVRILRGIVTEFSAFARPPATVLTPEDAPALLAAALAPYRTALPPGVRLSIEVADGVPPVLADRRLVERAVVNLVENALQAVGQAGTIAVRLCREQERVAIEVEDSGPGIDPEIRERIFEPFFSTKTGGSGLGLALVKKIAEDHGGGVALESQPGSTRVVLWLPAASASPE
jgi:signal transduction histidine kinase